MLELLLHPDPTKSPRVMHSVAATKQLFAQSQGSHQTELPNGNQLLSAGLSLAVREVSSPESGDKLLWQSRFEHDDLAHSYRAYRSPWNATT